jgi:hypothetical protein
METQELIIIEVFCTQYNVELALIDELNEFGLIEVVQDNGMKYIHVDKLPEVERVIRFHNELNINKEGIEVILNLLNRIDKISQQRRYLQDKLKLYE